ncbi:MAG: hypothetical protein LJF30_19000 [Acidobacteria bacterium]|nr:hypothetical protein [Acidobacteriota bacterium]
MASASPPVSAVSVTDAARDAIEHTRRNLFPIRVERWLVLGFLAFLDQCGRTLNGGGGGGGDGHRGGWPGGAHGFGEKVTEAVGTATAWLSAHAVEVTLGAILGLVAIAGVLALVLWINSRGTFMYLDNVASGRAEISRPWSQHAAPAQSYFGWRFGLSLAAIFVVLFGAGLVAVAAVAYARGRLEGAAGGAAALALLPVLVLLALALPLLALASLALRDFVAPLQLATGLRCGQAARVLESLVTQHPGAFVIYLLLKLVFSVGFGVLIFVGGCLTCCIGFLPVVMQVLFQPLFYFERSWSLFVLRQMGYDLPAQLAADQ